MAVKMFKKTDLEQVLEYVNNSADKARDLIFQENTDNTRHITTIIVCDQISRFIKKLQRQKIKEAEKEENGNNIRP